jgi:hypothetical protein
MTWSPVQYLVWNKNLESSWYVILTWSPVTFFILGPDIFLVTLLLNTLIICSLVMWRTEFHTYMKQCAKLYLFIFTISIFLDNGETQDSVSIGSRPFLNLLCSKFFCACDFDMSELFLNIWNSPIFKGFVSYLHVAVLLCILLMSIFF